MEVKRRWWYGLGAFGIAFLLIAGWVAWQLAQTPRYQWRTVNSWFQETSTHTNVFLFLQETQHRMRRSRTPVTGQIELSSPGVIAFRHFDTNATPFLISQLDGATNWWTRNDKTLRKWLPGFSHKWLPKPTGRAQQKKTALYLLSQLGTNATAHAALRRLITTVPRDPELMGRSIFYDPRMPVLVSTGGATKTTVESLMKVASSSGSWYRIMPWILKDEHLPILEEMLPQLLIHARSGSSSELTYYHRLFEGIAPGSEETMAFHEHAFRHHRHLLSVDPLVKFRPDTKTLVSDLFDLIATGGGKGRVRGFSTAGSLEHLPNDRDTAVRGLTQLVATRPTEILGKIPPLFASTNALVRASGVKFALNFQKGRTNPPVDFSSHIRPLANDRSPLVLQYVAEFLWTVHQEPEAKIRFFRESVLTAQYNAPDGLRQIRFLAKHMADHPPALDALIEVANDADCNAYRVSATGKLADLGKVALPLLKKLSQDPNPNVSKTAAAAVKRLESTPAPRP